MNLNIDPSLMQVGKVSRGGMFGNADWGSALAAALAGFSAAGGNPAGQMALQMLNQRMSQKREDQQYQRKRQDAIVDYEAKQKIDQLYPSAPQPTEYERMLSAAGYQPGTEEYLKHVRSYVDMKENPPYFYTDPTTGAVKMMGRNAGAMGQPAAPGVTFTPIDEGGPSQGGSGGFPWWEQ